MRLKRKFGVVAGMTVTIAVCVAATSPGKAGPPAPEFKNLKVLPKNISSKMLQQIMIDEFEDALGVGCGFCHAKEKGSERLDYASDAMPEKEIARNMMRMTMQVNKKYFQIRHPEIGGSSLIVTCTTCHHGIPHPDKDAE